MTDTITRTRLTRAQMEVICDAAGTDWVQAVVETFKALGVDLTDPDGPSIRPGDYQIPVDQWKAIAEACTATNEPADMARGIAAVNHMLDWMNYGPGSYEEG